MSDFTDVTFLTVSEAREIIRLGESKMYDLVHEAHRTGKPFLVTKLGAEYRIHREPFMKWARGETQGDILPL